LRNSVGSVPSPVEPWLITTSGKGPAPAGLKTRVSRRIAWPSSTRSQSCHQGVTAQGADGVRGLQARAVFRVVRGRPPRVGDLQTAFGRHRLVPAPSSANAQVRIVAVG
jgi:hypothetical protein